MSKVIATKIVSNTETASRFFRFATVAFAFAIASLTYADTDKPAASPPREANLPQWQAESLDLGIQNERRPWSFPLKDWVKNPIEGELTYEATGLPQWMSLDRTTGVLSGTPQRIDVGKYSRITLIASNSEGKSTLTALGEVLKTVQPPSWTKPELTLEDAFEESPYSRTMREFVSNPENATLKFEISQASPPAWLKIGESSGTLFGVPGKANIGPNSISVVVRSTIEGRPYSATSVIKLAVRHVNHPPKWRSDPLVLPDAFTKKQYSQDLLNSVQDPDDNEKFKFKILSGPAWAKVDESSGLFVGTPGSGDIGLNEWTLAATDSGGLTDTTRIRILIKKTNEPPRWAKPTVLPNAKEGQGYQLDLNGFATDPDGDALVFTKLDGPSWFTISATGALIGNPKREDVGPVKARVRVSDNLSGNDLTDVTFFVDRTNHAPTWVLDPVRLTVLEDQVLTADISVYAKDEDPGENLKFQVLEGPAWAKLSPAGIFTGTPKQTEVGENRYKVRTTDKEGLSAEALVIIQVNHVNHPPKFNKDPIVLKNAKEDIEYQTSLKEFVEDPDPDDKLRFEKIDLKPNWLTVAADGNLTAQPKRPDVGKHQFQVRVFDSGNEFAVANVRIEVEKVNKPPRWRQNPIQIGETLVGVNLSLNLLTYAMDEDEGDVLKFEKVSGPDWMAVSSAGYILGVPSNNDVGEFTAVIRVSDGQKSAETNATGTIVKKNRPPTLSPEIATIVLKERQTFKTSLNQPQYVIDPDGDPLKFTLLEAPPDWISMGDSGDLTAAPQFAHIGEHSLKFRASDGQLSVEGTLKIRVNRDPRPPIWIQDPIRFEAKTGMAFSQNLKSFVKDLDNFPILFKKKSGPIWLSVTPDGQLSGTPGDTDLGDQQFVLSACNDKTCSDARLTIKVVAGMVRETVRLDTPGTLMRVESLWTVDHSRTDENLIRDLKKAVPLYAQALTEAGVTFRSVFLSSDVNRWDGVPIRGSRGPILMETDPSTWSDDFAERADSAFVQDACGNCFSSPLWSIHRFWERLKDLGEIYPQDFYFPEVPLDVLIVSQQVDNHPYFARGNPEEKFNVPTIASNLRTQGLKERKHIRVSILAPRCPNLFSLSGERGANGPESTYSDIASSTGGEYFGQGECSYSAEKAVKAFAQKTILRARILGKKRIQLSNPIKDISSLTISLYGEPLVGNTQTPQDQWRYDARTNEIEFRWFRIDIDRAKADDLILIEYRAS